MTFIGSGAPGFHVVRGRSPAPDLSPVDEEPSYADLEILDSYYLPDRFQIPTGVLASGSKDALLATKMTQIAPPRPRRMDHGRGRPLCAVYAGVAMLLALGGGAALIAVQLKSSPE